MDLFHYARYGELNEVRKFIQKGTSVNSVNCSGQTALFFACENGHHDVAKFLLEKKAQVNYRAKPLIAAARNGHADCADLLLKHGAQVHCTNSNGETAMFVAVRKMNVSVILLLIDHGVRPQVPLESILPKMFSSANAEDAKLFHKLLTNGILSIKSDESITAAFQFAFKHGSLEMTSYLLSQHSSMKMEQVYPMGVYYSVKNNWYDMLTELLMKGVDVNVMTDSCTPLLAACESRSEKAVHLLLQYRANPNLKCEEQQPASGTRRKTLSCYSKNSHYNKVRFDPPLTSVSGVTGSTTPLLVACKMGLFVIAESLLHSGADPNLIASGNHPLSVACQHRHHELVKLLLENGTDVQATNENNQSALYHALESIFHDDSNPNLSSVNLLLDYGADTNTVTSSGKSPLYMACSRGHTATVQRMLNCGAKVNVSKGEKSPLNVACENRHVAVVELLLNEGADPNVPEEIADQCSYPLHIAAAGHSVELVTLLLNHGANINSVDASGNTALHLAIYDRTYMRHGEDIYVNCQKVVDTLLCAGVDVNVSNSKGKTSLYLAVEEGLQDLVDSMLSHGANPNVCAGDQYMLCTACDRQNVKVVEMLLKAGADPNLRAVDPINEVVITCDLPLCIAVQKGSCEIVSLLLNYGAKVNVLNSEKESVLCLVLIGMNDAFLLDAYDTLRDNKTASCMTKLLLEHGADVNLLMPIGHSALCFLLHQYCSLVPISRRRWIQKILIVEDLLHIFISNGANLDDLSSVIKYSDMFFDGNKLLETLCAWCSADQVSVELLKSGAGFKLLTCSCISIGIGYEGYDRTKSIRLCQAAIMAGYEPSSDELEKLQQSECVVYHRPIPEHVELLTWFNEDRQHAPSLMRQCRVAIRRQLSVASCNRTILPAIDQLPLPSRLQQYLKFEGCLTEVDLEDNEVHNPGDEIDTEASTGSLFTSYEDESEWDDYDIYFASAYAASDDMIDYDSDERSYESSD